MKLFKKAKETQGSQRNEPLFIKYVGDRLESGLKASYEIDFNNVLFDKRSFEQLYLDLSELRKAEKKGKIAHAQLESTRIELSELQEEHNDFKAKFEAHYDEAKEHVESLEARVAELEGEVEEKDRLIEGYTSDLEKEREASAKIE